MIIRSMTVTVYFRSVSVNENMLLGHTFFSVVVGATGVLAGIALNGTLLKAIDFAEANHPYRALWYKFSYVLLVLLFTVLLSAFVSRQRKLILLKKQNIGRRISSFEKSKSKSSLDY